jgi:dihydroxyacetone kinase
VCGDVFASPSVTAVLSAIQAVCGEAGALLIVKNYTGMEAQSNFARAFLGLHGWRLILSRHIQATG